MMNIVTFQGTNPGGQPMSTIYFSTGGFGALQGLDGADTTPGPSNMRAVPTEMWESLTGITIVHKRLLPDTGGHGEARGGLGQEIEFRNDTGAPLTAFCVAPALGVSGAGALRRQRRKPAHHPDRRTRGASQGCPHSGPGTALHHARRGRRGVRGACEPAEGEGAGRCRGGARQPRRRARGVRGGRAVGSSRVASRPQWRMTAGAIEATARGLQSCAGTNPDRVRSQGRATGSRPCRGTVTRTRWWRRWKAVPHRDRARRSPPSRRTTWRWW